MPLSLVGRSTRSQDLGKGCHAPCTWVSLRTLGQWQLCGPPIPLAGHTLKSHSPSAAECSESFFQGASSGRSKGGPRLNRLWKSSAPGAGKGLFRPRLHPAPEVKVYLAKKWPISKPTSGSVLCLSYRVRYDSTSIYIVKRS